MANKEDKLLIFLSQVGFYGINIWNPDLSLELTRFLERGYVCAMTKQGELMLGGQDI